MNMTTKNDITGDKIKSKPNNDNYRNNIGNVNWDKGKPSNGKGEKAQRAK